MPAKLTALLQSRKFWALIASLAAITTGYLSGQMQAAPAIQSAIAALAAYMIGTGLDSSNQPPALPAENPVKTITYQKL